ncbi:MAG TPA: hypothetical protein VH280_16650 [Verrucomicrobiae bacterium]|nr:hypothetical protein [Verrucomicrobiae bacterium]
MKLKLLLCLALALAVAANSFARLVAPWPKEKLQSAADLVVLATPIGSEDLNETNSLGYSQFSSFHGFRGVDTTFRVLDVLKGMPGNDHVVLHHYLEDFSPPDCPTFISFPPADTNKYVLYLAKDGQNRYAPVAGQIDPGLSIKLVKTERDLRDALGFHFPMLPPSADANPAICHAVQIHVPVQLHATRREDAIVIKTDELMATNLAVGSHVFTGTSTVLDIYCNGKRVTGTDSMSSKLADGGYDDTFRRGLYHVPEPGKKYTVIVTLTYFETDEPPQHMWEPREGNYYKVLCEQKFTLSVQ